MKAAIYCRISHDPLDQRQGVDRQQQECEELAEQRGISVVEVFTDNDAPATDRRRRKEWKRMLEALDRQEFDSVVAWANDRLYRDATFRLEVMQAVQKSGGRIVTKLDGDVNPSDASGRMVMGVLGEVAAFERERMSERQKARWRRRKQDGKLTTLGKRPFGLQRRGDELVEVKKEADAIRRAARQLIEGRSLYSVVRELPPTPYGGNWRASHFKRALLSDHMVRYGILDEATHKLVAARLKSLPQRKAGRPHREYALRGLARCGLCNSKLGGTGGSYICQDSKCGRIGVRANLLEPFVLDALMTRVAGMKLVARDAEPESDDALILEELAAIEQQRTELAGDIQLPVDVLSTRIAALDERREELTKQLGRPAPPSDPYRWLASWAAAGFPEASLPADDESREMYAELIERVVVKPASNGRWTPIADRVRIDWH